MRFRKYLEKRAYLLNLIETNTYGNAVTLAYKVGISRRTFFDYLSEYREEGILIVYDKSEKKYKIKIAECNENALQPHNFVTK